MRSQGIIDPLLTSCRRLFLREFETHINIGVHDHEKRAEQRVLIDIDAYVALTDCTPQSDELDEVVDYDLLQATISRTVNNGHIHLQETLCDMVAIELLKHPKIVAVRVATAKPDVYPNCRAVGVESFRSKFSEIGDR